MKTHIKKSIVSTVILALALATPALADLTHDEPATRPIAPFPLPASLPLAELDQDAAKAAIQNPSTIKIASNAHAADAGNGILFNWDSKQKDNTVITVTADDDVTTSFSIIIQSSGKYFIGQVEIAGSGTVTIDKPSKNINMVYIAGLQVTATPVTPPTGLSDAVIRYYAICQLWNDLMWGADGYGLSADYNGRLSAEEKEWMLPVGIAHRTALQIWWDLPVGDQDVRYIPVKSMAIDFAAEWADIILNDAGEYGLSLQVACDRLGIDVEDFIRNYDAERFVDCNDLW